MLIKYTSLTYVLVTLVLSVSGCSKEDTSSGTDTMSSSQPEQMVTAPMPSQNDSTVVQEEEMSGADKSMEQSSVYLMAVADPRRPAEDMERDTGRRPAEIMEFFGVKPGHHVVDLSSSTGYFTRIMSVIVGTEGSVVAQNSGPRITDEFMAQLETQYADYGNVVLNYEAPEAMSLPDNSVDAVFLFLIVHHWHYMTEEGEATPAVTKARYANIVRMLKPGGVFGIIEHKAADDMTREASAAIHRIPHDIAVADITSAGFVLDAESDLLANHPEDNISAGWNNDATPRDMTQRIVQLYRKPAE